MQVDGYAIDILVQGFPGKTVCHGGLGWSTVVLIRGHGKVAMIDTGNFNVRSLLIDGLRKHGLTPSDLTDLLLTHTHWDHCVNWTLFPKARIVVGAQELDWAVKQPWGETAVPELYVRDLQHWPTTHRATEGEEILPGLTAHIAPGHTPGHLIYRLAGRDHDVIFSGDAAKNRAEMLCGRADNTYDQSISMASIAAIWDMWRHRAGTILVPGHDIPMVLRDGHIEYLAGRNAVVKAWFGDALEETTTFELKI